MKYFLIGIIVAFSFSLAAFAQNYCFGVNCAPSSTDLDSLDDQFTHINEALFSSVWDTLDRDPDERDRCMLTCLANYRIEKEKCDIFHGNRTGWGIEVQENSKDYSVCMAAKRQRYSECLDPFKNCPP